MLNFYQEDNEHKRREFQEAVRNVNLTPDFDTRDREGDEPPDFSGTSQEQAEIASGNVLDEQVIEDHNNYRASVIFNCPGCDYEWIGVDLEGNETIICHWCGEELDTTHIVG